MPYSARYIMQEAARGRPFPSGAPEDHLLRAIEHVSAMEIDSAVHMGASMQAPLGRHGGAAAVLVDRVLTSQGQLRADPYRILECVRALVRHRADFNAAPLGQTSPAARLAVLAPSPVGAALFELLRPLVRWNDRNPEGNTVAETWKRHAPEAWRDRVPSASRGPRAG